MATRIVPRRLASSVSKASLARSSPFLLWGRIGVASVIGASGAPYM